MDASVKSSAQLLLRPRLTAIAASTAEVVRAAGGWLFDRSMAGWDVNVLTTDHADPRSLRILGAGSHDLEALLASPVALGPCLQAIAAPADLLDRDERVRRMAYHALKSGPAELRLWDGPERTEPSDDTPPEHHHLSFAARAFKAQALAALGIPGEAADTEVFRSLSSPA